MIVLRNLTKIFEINGTTKVVADNINAVFPTGVSVALMGRNGAGKSTLLKVIAGTSAPTRGEVLSDGRISFPVGLASSMHPDMTGAQNTRFVARIYGAETDEMSDFVAAFSELGEHFHLPVRTYSSGMKSRLSFGINMALQFETYLIDEITAAGDAAFKDKSRRIFNERMKDAGAIFVSHSKNTMRDMCQAGAVLENGQLTYYDDIEDALLHHDENMKAAGAGR
ncbi:ABC transporter ATP-binding protein [Salipiger mucosus]|uniref:Capsular polysaccharide ABC transporter, ATP-binding protein KpsT n=1 Tax=Salipiger mucosus DSM 16094 TaxID=1123237 RepID=S9RNK7_9RHOB|nr:ABC transporter ATP-binding protein [Salipiger mucosus]EPX75554.1 Capsular polysaccharide ABC transporter, ATP-binding protein KpsT [Salipiger mucosus DSM 16094]